MMIDCRNVRALEVDNIVDEAFVPVRRPDGTHDVECVVVLRVTDGELEWVDPDDWSWRERNCKLTLSLFPSISISQQ